MSPFNIRGSYYFFNQTTLELQLSKYDHEIYRVFKKVKETVNVAILTDRASYRLRPIKLMVNKMQIDS